MSPGACMWLLVFRNRKCMGSIYFFGVTKPAKTTAVFSWSSHLEKDSVAWGFEFQVQCPPQRCYLIRVASFNPGPWFWREEAVCIFCKGPKPIPQKSTDYGRAVPSQSPFCVLAAGECAGPGLCIWKVRRTPPSLFSCISPLWGRLIRSSQGKPMPFPRSEINQNHVENNPSLVGKGSH